MPNDLPAVVDGSRPIDNETLLSAAIDKMDEHEDATAVEVLVAADENVGLEALIRERHIGAMVRVRRGGLGRMAGVIIPLFGEVESTDIPAEVDTSEADDLGSRMVAEAVRPGAFLKALPGVTDKEHFRHEVAAVLPPPGQPRAVPADVWRTITDTLGFYAHSERDDRGARARSVLDLIEREYSQ